MTAIDTHGRDDNSANGSLTKDAIFHILSNERRRHTLDILSHTGEMDRGELSTKVAAREYNKPPEQISSKERKRVHVSLYQCHIPKLLDYGVINENGDSLSLADGTDELLSHMHYDPNGESIVTRIKYIGGSIF